MMPSWRTFPEGVPIPEILDHAEEAARGGDWVAAGNWYFHAKRRGSAEARDRVHNLRPQLEEAASLGDTDAKVLVAALLLDRGEGLGRAADLLEEAAQAGAVEGLRELGFMLNDGIGVPADPVRANDLFRRAAEAGDGYAAFNLAVNFYRGHGTGKNAREFTKWLQVAADLGIPEACAVLGDQFAIKGREEEALRWYVRAAKSSHAPAMLAAALRYRDGVGTAADPVQAVRWFLSMLDRGNGDGIHDAIQLARSMTLDQVREAGRLSGHPDEAESLIGR
ncbi:tetratricopeptide repeat protein [Streptomyces sp. NPDC006527]|uniref:tetratricopeptide repeat protein n=1 Tax=Streptomyces sp. NPDC006527 TaxID=3364749 RepID=UPI0036CF4D25